MSETAHIRSPRSSRLMRIIPALAIAGAMLTPVSSHAAVTHTVHLFGDGNASGGANNGRTPDFYVAPGTVHAASGDTIRVVNWQTTKTASYSPALSGAPTTYAVTTTNGTYDVNNPFATEFLWTAPGTGTTVVTFSGGKCGGACSNRLTITTAAPVYPPSSPVLTSPTPGQVLSSNDITISGHSAVNGDTYRVELWPADPALVPRDFQYYGDIDGFGEFSGYMKKIPNGLYTVVFASRNYEGYEKKLAPFQIRIAGNDVELPYLGLDPVKYQTVNWNFLSINRGPVAFSGVLRDDIRAKSIKITVQRTTYPTGTTTVDLRCTRGYPADSTEKVPCDSATNPQWVKFQGEFAPSMFYGSYTATITWSDGVNGPYSVTRSFTIHG